MKLIRQSDGSLRIDVVGWGIEEMGISLSNDIRDSILNLIIMHECGVVDRWTPAKASFTHVVEPEQERELSEIEYGGGLIKLTIGRR